MKDLTTGSIIKHIFTLSVPTMVGFTLQMVYDMVDIFWIGMISAEALAGVTIFGSIFWLIGSLNDIIGQSSVSLISQNYGRKDLPATQASIEQTITFKVIMALIAGVLMALFLKPLIYFFTTDENVVKAAFDYGYIRLYFLPVMFASYSVNTILRCMGDAKTPMYLMFFTSVLNVILDPVFMFPVIPGTSIPGVGLGTFGAALATVISQTTAFLIGFAYLFSKKNPVRPSVKGLFRLNWGIDKKLLSIGLPSGLENISRNVSQIIVMKFVSTFGTTVIAAIGISSRILGIGFMPLMGVSMGAATIVGQNLGAEKIDRAVDTSRWAARIVTIFIGIFILLCWIFGDAIMGVFAKDSEIIRTGVMYMTYGMLGMVFLAYAFGLSCVFGGSGYNFPFVVSSGVSRWIIMIPFLFLTITVLKLDILWIMFAYIAADISEAAVLWFYFAKGTWKLRRVG
jgi:putative MATE family efflux protein